MIPKSLSLRKAFGWSLAQHWGARAITFVVFLVLARLLKPVDFGLVALATIVTSFTEVFIDQGFGDAVVQSAEDNPKFLSTAFWVNIVTALALVVIVLSSAGYIAQLFKAEKLAPIIRVLSVTFFFTALSSVQVAVLRRRLDYKSLALRTALANLLSGIIAVTMALFGFGVWSLVGQQIVYSAVSAVVVWEVAGFRPSFAVDRKSFAQLMHFGLKVCGVKTVDLLHTRLIDSLIGIRLGAVLLGIYSIGVRLGITVLQLLGASVSDVSLAHFSSLRRSGVAVGEHYLKMLKRIASTSAPIFGFLAIEAHGFVHLLFGHKWDGAAPIFAAFSTLCTVQILIYFSNSVMNAVGRPGLQLVLSIVKLALLALAFFVFVHNGINAIAWGITGVTVFLMAPTSLLIMAWLLNFRVTHAIRVLWRPYICVVAAGLATYTCDRFLWQPTILGLGDSAIVFFGTFVGLYALIDPGARTTLRALCSAAQKALASRRSNRQAEPAGLDGSGSRTTEVPPRKVSMFQVSRQSKGYIPTLDGWRAIAILAVVFYHSSAIYLGSISLRPIQEVGRFGVQLFFSISGLLICGKLLDEEARSGSISLPSFYIRRLFRIQPAAITYLLCLALLAWFGVVSAPFWSWTSSLLSFRNFYTASFGYINADLYTNHFWSLAVEEHFYVLLPLILVLFARWRLRTLAVLSAISILWLIVGSHLYLKCHPFAGGRTDFSISGLIFPAMLAVIIRRKKYLVWIEGKVQVMGVFAALAFIASLTLLHNLLLMAIIATGFPFLILSTMLRPHTLFARLLEVAPLRYLGRISYSVYLWQQLFFVNRAMFPLAGHPLNYFQSWPLNLLGIFVMANLSYYAVETPLIRIGHKVVTSGRRRRVQWSLAPKGAENT